MLTDIRLRCQQLADPRFHDPKELVSWMGAMQAQDYRMAKWAVGVRLRSATLSAVDDALNRGYILRTHVMRPTWHFVAAEDIRWMVRLSAQRIRSANESLGRTHRLGFTEETYRRGNRQLEKMLCGGKSLTKAEVRDELTRAGLPSEPAAVTRFLMRAEADGLVCSGPDRGGKPTYALLEERVPPVPELTKEESLARLADRYFRSHSPATAEDFAWWSGLPVAEVREAITLLGSTLIKDGDWLIHTSCRDTPADDILHLLPAYDEYLIGYKERTGGLAPEHQAKAFNRFGIFQPVVLHNGRIVGNWSRRSGRSAKVGISCFESDYYLCSKLSASAESRYITFHEDKR